MNLLEIICSNVIVLIHHCLEKVEGRPLFTHEESYYEYVPDRQQWSAARTLCHQRSGTLAVASNAEEIQNLHSFLLSLNITQPVWIEKDGISQISAPPDIFMLEFPARPHRKSSRLRHKFLNMELLTVCAHLQFNRNCHGLSTVFSYSVKSFINELQLQARILENEPIQLALIVHGSNTTYVKAFPNDASWNFVCASWIGNGGKWSIWANGVKVGSGSSLNASDHIGGDGLFIIGQEQDTFGGYKSDKALCGNITQLYMWDSVLLDSEIQNMGKECSPVSSGLFFKWRESVLEIETSLQTRRGNSLCQGMKSHSHDQLTPLLDSSFHHNLSDVHMSKKACVTFDPASRKWIYDFCTSSRGSVCLFHKEQSDIFGFPGTPFFTQVSNELHSKPDTDDKNLTLFPANELTRDSSLLMTILRVMDNNAEIITHSDLLYLIKTIEKTSATQHIEIALKHPTMFISMISNCLKLGSRLIDPNMADRWKDLRARENHSGLFSVVESIDKLLWTLADVLWAERKSFTMSTKNMDVHLEPRSLSQMSCSCVFKPSVHSSQFSSYDEILIPDSEVQRVFSLGHKEVMFIHTYYSHLLELSKLEAKTLDHQNTDSESHYTGQLATAVISATVRDVSRAENVPVSVQYTLSSGTMAEFPKRVTPLCVFWNVGFMAGRTSDWSNKGCRVLPGAPDVTSCFCNHTTNFAVLMNYMEPEWTTEELSILTKLTFIGSGASLCALVITLMLFTVLDIPKSDRTSVHRNLFVSLICAQIVLLCSGSAIHNKVACMLVAALMHLFFMAAFSWMLVEGLLLWSKVVSVNLSEDRHMKYYYLIGWGLPALIVTITLASASGKYSADGHCWLSVQNGVIWGFAGPVIFIIMVNVMILTRVVVITIGTAKRRSLMMTLNSSPEKQVSEQIKAAVKAVLVLLPILGLTWVCGVLVPFSVAIAYVFSLLNSLQGLFIFLIYGVYNTEVRNTLNRIKERRKALHFSNCANSRPSSSVSTSRQGSSPVAGAADGHTVNTSHSSSSSTHSDSGIQSYSKTRHLSLLCVHDNPNEEPRCPDTGVQLSGQEHLSKPKHSVPNECNLNVPMEAELTSCHSLSSSPQQNGTMCLH
ncbi:adhesion G-protein coupled receptor D2 [Triplophysa dalaica]|uniref:adhesion G-protein coupled receptor D2 n=1 Tax=Triplophysa dalaica TaxID=1582913 RepID=UPI0024DFAE98|nr:adhesion G-protein coupled receptor D2 [Triplophysa dalaica]XP_056613781.1 adhesion G-protein coupled receptor D2 [Triplophysa dalaica]